jgi:hypothetical protein
VTGNTIWDDEEIQPTGGDFVKFAEIGDSVIGTITAIRKQRFEDSDGVTYAPQIDLDTADGERTLTAGAVKLRQLFIEQRPEVGDRIKVVHVGKSGRVKLFTLDVRRGEAKEPVKAQSRKAAPPPDDDIPF